MNGTALTMNGTALICMAWESTLSDEALTRQRFPYTDDEIRRAVAELEPTVVRPRITTNAAPWLRAILETES